MGLALLTRLFQETNVLVVHLIGAILAFGLGAVYCCMHTHISYKMAPILNSRCLANFRLLLSILITVGFISSILALLQVLPTIDQLHTAIK